MGKAVKWIGLILGGIILLIILILLVAPMFIDVGKYKPQIEGKVAEFTGRSFSIGGDLKLSLFPWAGITFSDLHLGNPEGFKERDFLSVKSFDVRMKLIPLLSRDIQIKRFVVVGPRIVLEKRKDGRTNWEGLGGDRKKGTGKRPVGEKPGEKGESSEGLPIKGLAVGEFAVREGEALWIDGAAGSSRKVTDLTVELRDVSLDRPIQLDFSAKADGKPVSLKGRLGPLGKDPGKGALPLDLVIMLLDQLNISMKGQLTDPAARPRFDLVLKVAPFSPRKLMEAMGQHLPLDTKDPQVLNHLALNLEVKGDTGNVSISKGRLDLDQSKMDFSVLLKDFSKPDVKFDMMVDKIDVDRYLPPPSDREPAKGEEKPAPKERETDYAPLRKPVVNGEIRIGELKIKGAGVREIRIKINGRNGLYTVDPFSLKAYEGSLLTKVTLDVRNNVPKTTLNLEGENFKVRPLLKDVLQKDFLEGTTFTRMTLSMEGDDADRIKRTLNGEGDLRFKDGAIVGIDLTGMVKNLKASFGLEEKPTEQPRTDFSEFDIPFTLKNGLANTPGTRLTSPILRIVAAGKAHLVQETLDFRVEPKFVATLKGQGDAKERSGILVPVLVSGTFSSPKFRPDLKGMLKQQLEVGIPQPEDIKKMLEGVEPGKEGQETPKSPEETIKGIFKGFKSGQ